MGNPGRHSIDERGPQGPIRSGLGHRYPSRLRSPDMARCSGRELRCDKSNDRQEGLPSQCAGEHSARGRWFLSLIVMARASSPLRDRATGGARLCVDLTMGRCARRWHRDPLHRCAARHLGPRAWPRCSRCAPAGLGAWSSSPLSPTSLWPPARPHRTDGPGPAMRLDRTARGARWDSRIKRISACSGWVAMGLLPSGSGSGGLWTTRNGVLQWLYVRHRTEVERLRVYSYRCDWSCRLRQ